MKIPVINIQEAHELCRRLYEAAKLPTAARTDPPYREFFMVYTSGFEGDARGEYHVKHHCKILEDGMLHVRTSFDFSGASVDGSERQEGFRDAWEHVFPVGIGAWNPFTHPIKSFVLSKFTDSLGDTENRERVERYNTQDKCLVTFALNLLNCKNVVLVDKAPKVTRQERRYRERKGMAPYASYKVLEIKPMGRKSSAAKNAAQGQGAPHRMHTVRGHFKTFTEERPLFGRVVGTIWWGDCVKGNEALGMVEKDYDIRITEDAFLGG